MFLSSNSGAPAAAITCAGGYGSRVALAVLACPGRRGWIQLSKSHSHASASSRRKTPELRRSRAPQRARGMPGARCTHSLACGSEKHTSVVTTGSPGWPGIPCAMVLRLIPRSPRRPGFLATVASHDAKHRRRLDASVGASGPHGFAVRKVRARQPCTPRPLHPASTFVTVAIRPSYRGGTGRACRDDLPDDVKSEIFLLEGLDTNLREAPVGQISWAKVTEILEFRHTPRKACSPHERSEMRGHSEGVPRISLRSSGLRAENPKMATLSSLRTQGPIRRGLAF